LLVVFAIVYAATICVAGEIVGRLQTQTAELRGQLDQFGGTPESVQWALMKPFGDPPVPYRPSHPSRLGGDYYRGNCERNPKLYNRGNYQTAIFRLALCGADNQPLERGSPASEGSLQVRFEIVRAPHATPQLFTTATMNQVFLSSHYLKPGAEENQPAVTGEQSRVKLETIQAGEHWEACWPIPPKRDENGRLKGLVYIYPGGSGAAPHYGICYDLRIEQGAISQDSELWMNALFVPAAFVPPTDQKLPFCEWFDDRPLPVIEGGNTTDPKLLGVEEHLGKTGPGTETSPPQPNPAPAATPPDPASPPTSQREPE
jgi:hypothetical protein